MKKISILTVTFVVIFLWNGLLQSQQVMSIEELVVVKKEELDNTEWNIIVTPVSKKGQYQSDVISFKNGKFTSKNLLNEGFGPTGFTLRIEEDGSTDDAIVVIWETMQMDKEGNYVFWRGDIRNGVMRGILSKQNDKGRISDFLFKSK
jgi:hypothetical protein